MERFKAGLSLTEREILERQGLEEMFRAYA
jgi:hypothetical protein